MKSFTITEPDQCTNKISGVILLSDYIRTPLRYGLTGFALMFLVSSMMKFFGFLIGAISGFEIGFNEILLSVIGFTFLFLIRFLANFKVAIAEKVTVSKNYASEAA